MISIAQRLKELSIELPRPPRPIANYVPLVQEGNLLFLSGQGPLDSQGQWQTGKVGDNVSVDVGYQHARLTGVNLLAQLNAYLGSLDRVSRIVKLLGMVNCAPTFTEQPKVINGCSDLFIEVFGEAIGRHARSAVGVASLPHGITVEIEAVIAVRPD